MNAVHGKDAKHADNGIDTLPPDHPSAGTDATTAPPDAREQFRLLMENVADYALFFTDPKGNITGWNAGAERILGYTEAEALGKPIAVLFTPEDRANGQPEREMAKAAAEGRTEDERWHQRKDGTRFWASGVLTALRDEADGAGKVRGFAKILRDITERRRTEQALEAGHARDHHIAETLQHSLLLAPSVETLKGLQVEPFYVPALAEANVGGDFFDAFPLDAGRIALMVGDASGKGLPAAVRTVEVKFAVRAFLTEYPYPARTLSRVNGFLYHRQRRSERPEEREGFVALALAVVDPVNGEVVLAVAGTEPPLLVRGRHGCPSEPIDVGGPPLGVDPDADYAVRPAWLGSNDTLLLTTDGLTEARRGDSTFLGYEGLVRLAEASCDLPSLKDMGRAVLDGAQAFAGGALHDDTCLLLARLR